MIQIEHKKTYTMDITFHKNDELYNLLCEAHEQRESNPFSILKKFSHG